MGANIGELTTLSDLGALFRGCRVLDIGAQNLVSIKVKALVDFVMSQNPIYDIDDLGRYAAALAELSEMDPTYGGLNGAWLGDLLRRCGIEYMAFDIFDGEDTVVIDLNRQKLPVHCRNSFDLCLNCGTTEHILNQFNCFEVMHDALKPGGYIYHALPVSGLFDHGYFSYNPDFFEALAVANEYRVVDSWIGGGGPAVDYGAEFRRKYPVRRTLSAAAAAPVAPVMIQFIAQKTVNGPFRAPLETRTTAREVSRAFPDRSPSDSADAAPREPADTAAVDYDCRLATLRERLFGGLEVGTGEILDLARLSGALGRSFCLFLEEHALHREAAADPTRQDLTTQLDSVRNKIVAKYPGYPYVRRLLAASPSEAIDQPEDPAPELRPVLAYWRHCLFDTIACYPPELELLLLERTLREPEDDLHRYHLRRRRAELLGTALRERAIKLADVEPSR